MEDVKRYIEGKGEKWVTRLSREDCYGMFFDAKMKGKRMMMNNEGCKKTVGKDSIHKVLHAIYDITTRNRSFSPFSYEIHSNMY